MRSFTLAKILMTLTVTSAEAATGCPSIQGLTVHSGITVDDSTICILGNEKKAELIITNSSSGLVIQNEKLIEASDISEGVIYLEKNENLANLYFEYPSSAFLITINANTGKLESSSYSIRTEEVGIDSAGLPLTLITKQQIIRSSSISQVTKKSLFGQNKLEIASRAKLNITSPKAYLWSNPNDSSPTKLYLVRGDKIEASQYKDGKLKIIYTTKSGKRIEKWIEISSAL